MVINDRNIPEPNYRFALGIKFERLRAHVLLDDFHHLLFGAIIQTDVINLSEILVDIQKVFDHDLSLLDHFSIEASELREHLKERAGIEPL